LTVKVADDFPLATLTLDGNVAFVELLASLTTKPPIGAAPVSNTVPVEDIPPLMLDGLKLTDSTVDGFTVRLADSVAD
jgi:hypothetical protein